MYRLFLGAAAVALLPAVASAQFPRVATGGLRAAPFGPGLATGVGMSPYLPGRIGSGFATPFNFSRPAISGYSGLYPYPQLYTPYGSYFTGGGFITSGYGYGYSPYFTVPGPFAYDQPAVEEPPAPPGRVVELSNEYPATLTLEFPAAAKVWLDGKAVEGEAGTVRELTSPVLKTGQTYTFKVKAQWDVKGKTVEYTRDVTLGSGDRSKLLVMSGTPVAQK